jgi:hypothetical protein
VQKAGNLWTSHLEEGPGGGQLSWRALLERARLGFLVVCKLFPVRESMPVAEHVAHIILPVGPIRT